ncbi:MAG: ABC transporter substrate-binding protein, partial [Pirellulales bacterium]
YHFKLKRGIHFHDDPCFPGGKGRELTARDVFYSWKRMADNDKLPKSWWLFEKTIAGFDDYRRQQNAADRFDYDAPVDGLKMEDDTTFTVTLTEPVQRFLWVLAMFQTAVVPREAVEEYGDRFGRHPVGTGPFTLDEKEWIPSQSMVFRRNENYHNEVYPTEHMPEDGEGGLTGAAGRRLPLVDRVEIRMFVQDQPMWLQFRNRKVDYLQVPAEYFPEAFVKRTRKLKRGFRREGVTAHAVPLLDFIFRGFNMQDPLLGGYTDRKRWLRQAISLALDWQEQNDAFYNGINLIYDGPIPPGLDGYPPDGNGPISFRGPDLARARELLAKAGYPGGKGLPAIEFYTSRGGNSAEQVEMLTRQLSQIGVRINVRLVDFSTLIEAINNKKAPFFSFAWGSDYPDAENNLALFYGPNESPGSNHFNYRRPGYDKLYETIRVMPPSPERTALYEKMRDMIIEDAPFAGSMARTRFYLVNPRLKNFKPAETFYNWIKYLDVDAR